MIMITDAIIETTMTMMTAEEEVEKMNTDFWDGTGMIENND